MPRRTSVPALRRHAPSKQGVVRLNGKDHYLGRWPDDCPEAPPEVSEKYDQRIADWLARGRQSLPALSSSPNPLTSPTIGQLILAYWPEFHEYYRHADGTPTPEVNNIRLALRRLRRLYGKSVATEFDSVGLDSLRQHMIQEGLARSRINRDIPRIKRMFRWAASKKLIPATIWQELQTLNGLRQGRSAAKETSPVRPVPDSVVDATIPYLLPPVAAIVRLQRLTGARPGEITILRPCDVDTTGPVWCYRPGSDASTTGKHKNAWRGHERCILIGPKAQAILAPFLKNRIPTAFCFSPAEARAYFDRQRRTRRKSKVPPCQQNRRRKTAPKKSPGDRYNSSSYATAVADACRRMHVASCGNCVRQENEPRRTWLARIKGCPGLASIHWHPNQLRHTAATEIRKVAGLDPARAVLGHRSPAVTTVYAEADMERAGEIMKRIG